MRPKPSLIFGEGMSWLLQLSQAQLFTFPLSEQGCLRPAAWWRVYVWARVCPSASKHGYWQGALATQLIPGYGDTNNGAQVNWEPLARRATRFPSVKQIYPLVIVVREDIYCGVIDRCSLSMRVSMSPLVQRGSREAEEKVQLMERCYMIDVSPPLAWASIYFITTLFTPWLCTSWGLGVQSAKRAILIAYWNSLLWWMDTH